MHAKRPREDQTEAWELLSKVAVGPCTSDLQSDRPKRSDFPIGLWTTRLLCGPECRAKDTTILEQCCHRYRDSGGESYGEELGLSRNPELVGLRKRGSP